MNDTVLYLGFQIHRSIASANPVRLSVQAMKISSMPRFRSPLSTVAQYFALSFSLAKVFSPYPQFTERLFCRLFRCQWLCTPPSSLSVLHSEHDSVWRQERPPNTHSQAGVTAIPLLWAVSYRLFCLRCCLRPLRRRFRVYALKYPRLSFL